MRNFEYKNYIHENDHISYEMLIGSEEDSIIPLLSVIMPIYNHPDYFEKSLKSVVSQHCDFEFEIVIIDNGHPEFQSKNQKIVEKYECKRIRYYINKENIGGVGSENRGILLSKGEYVTFCHDDDILFHDALQNLINAKNFSLPNSAIFGAVINIDEKDDILLTGFSEWNSFLLRKKIFYSVNMYDLLKSNYSNGCGTLYNRRSLTEMGGFCKDYIPCPDYALNAKYVSLYGGLAIRKETLKQRISAQSDSSTAYVYLNDANYKVRSNILKSGFISPLFPKFLVSISQKTGNFHTYSLWGAKKNRSALLFIYRVITRLYLYILLFSRRYR